MNVAESPSRAASGLLGLLVLWIPCLVPIYLKSQVQAVHLH
jgi:hypothetical protein